jgi:AcrR family transcriptional regulator
MIRKLNPEKREGFLNAALKLFVANGVQNTSTAAIAKEAGTAAGTLFLYFPTKQELVDELVLQIGQALSEAIEAVLEPSLSAQETILAIWNGTIHWFQPRLEAYQYIQQVRDNSNLISEHAAQESGQFAGYYILALQKGLAEGVIKSYPMALVGEMLYHAIVAVMNLIKMEPDPAKQDEYIQAGFEIFWNGIKAV